MRMKYSSSSKGASSPGKAVMQQQQQHQQQDSVISMMDEQLPLLPGASSSAASSSKTGGAMQSHSAVGGSAANSSSPSFFSESSILRNLFVRSLVGYKVRSRVCLAWGLFSLALSFTVLKLYYKNTASRSFFIATTTLTTIGYGMSDKDGQTTDYPFLSVFFAFFVLPFSFLQSLTYIDSTQASAALLSTRIAARCRRGVNASQAFVTEFWSTMAVTTTLLIFLIFLGMVCYSYFGKATSWKKGIFYAITSATTIGYGSFEVQNDYGYWAVGVYAISCNYIISIIFPSIACFFVVAAENIEQVDRIRTEQALLSQQVMFRIDQQGAIM